MGTLRRILLRLLTVFRHGRSERELAHEVDAHLGELQRDFERRGLSPEEARSAARREFGGIEQVKERPRAPDSDELLRAAGLQPAHAGYLCRHRYVLVGLGIFGVLAYTVSQQTREIAIRLALGGQSGDVTRMIVRFGLQLVAAGLLIGLGISFATNRLLTAQLWNTSPNDPVTFAAVILLITAIGALACWVPRDAPSACSR